MASSSESAQTLLQNLQEGILSQRGILICNLDGKKVAASGDFESESAQDGAVFKALLSRAQGVISASDSREEQGEFVSMVLAFKDSKLSVSMQDQFICVVKTDN